MPLDRPLEMPIRSPPPGRELTEAEAKLVAGAAARECAFVLVAVRLADRKNLLRCAKCGRELWTPNTLAFAPCPAAPRSPCAYRSPQAVEERECPTCAGHVRVKLFPCALHQLCSIAKPLAGAATCATCLDFEASEPDARRPESQ